MKALFLTEDPPTDFQIAEIENRFGPIEIALRTDLSTPELQTDEQVTTLLQDIADTIGEVPAHESAIFGTFTAPVLEQITTEGCAEFFPQGTRFIRCYSAWETSAFPRTAHKRWCPIGKLPIPPCGQLAYAH